jgi:hypothetical protein
VVVGLGRFRDPSRILVAQRHSDGTLCKEGTTSVPKGFAACCAAFSDHVATCDFDVRYEWRRQSRDWVIAIPESAGGGGVRISFCPHCGSRLGARRKGKGKS